MKKTFAVFAVALALVLCACNSEKNLPENDENTSGADLYVAESSQSGDANEEKTVLSFVDGSKSFIDARTGKTCTVFTLPEVNDYYLGKENRYACADLDSDGKNEILVEYDVGGDTAVLHEKDGVWTAYHINFRERKDLKTNGEMMWSAGADYSGTHRLTFSDGEMKSHTLLDSAFSEDVHSYEGQEISSDEAFKKWEEFDKKTMADWFDIYPAFEQ